MESEKIIRIDKSRVVNEDGEIMWHVPVEGNKIVSLKHSEAGRKHFRVQGDQRLFTFSNMENIVEMTRGLTPTQCGYLLLLQCHMQFETGLLVRKVRDGTRMIEKPMGREDIQKTLNIGRSVFYKLMSQILKSRVIIEKNKHYYINSKLHFRNYFDGDLSDMKLIKIYLTTFKELYKELRPNQVGFIYKLLPLIHYETNTICSNPFEKDITKVKYLKDKEIGKVIGMDTRTVRSMLKKLSSSNPKTLAHIRVGDDEFYKLNPWIFYRKKGEPEDQTLREIFSISR